MATDTAKVSYENPKEECDLIMKGGATSGLIYPKAVLELARDATSGEPKKVSYRFRAIGGTSAGAIAAAFTAAAEYKRKGGGFERLRAINLKLQEIAPKKQTPGKRDIEPTFLSNLFQGSKATQPLMEILLRMTHYSAAIKALPSKKGHFLRIIAALRLAGNIIEDSGISVGKWQFLLALAGLLLAALLAGVIGALSGSWVTFPWTLVVLGLLFGVIGFYLGGLAAGLGGLLHIALTEVPKNGFGICSGRRDPENSKYTQDAAMEFVHQSIQEIAGRTKDDWKTVLTFSDLEAPDPERPDPEPERPEPERPEPGRPESELPGPNRPDPNRSKPPNIKLEVMVANVSEGRPYVLPFDEPFIFRKQDFDKLFPEPIVTRLTGNARTIAGIKLPKEQGYYFLPKGADLPVAVAARISMSHPLIFSSVPLYALPLWARELIEHDAKGENHCLNIESAPVQVPPQSLCELTVGGTPAADPKDLKATLKEKDRWNDPAKAYAPKPEDLIPHWFSDGGIASNFPIHFFDQWLPQRPTFGITLRYLPEYAFAESKDPDERRAKHNYSDSMERSKEPEARSIGKQIRTAQAAPKGARPDIVVLPGPEDTVPLEWQHILCPDTVEPRIGVLPGFLGAVIKTMQNYRDNAQAALPSYRERVVQVRLKPDEGGFNLAMGKKEIECVVNKGHSAGERVRQQFNKEHHQWARLRVLVSEFDEKFRSIRSDKRYDVFEKLVTTQQDKTAGFPYFEGNENKWCDRFVDRLKKLKTMMDGWNCVGKPKDVLLEAGAPPPVLRVTPNV